MTQTEQPISILCPHCLGHHDPSVRECPKTQREIPNAYVNTQLKGMPHVGLLLIGYGGHGKTCYLVSLLRELFEGAPCRRWDGLSFMGLTKAALDKIHDEYVTPLNAGILPQRTRSHGGTETLILKFNKFPQAKYMPIIRLRQGVEQKDLVLTIYDIGGETYTDEGHIATEVDIIVHMKGLVVLVDLTRVHEEAQDKGTSATQQLHELLNNIFNALETLGQNHQKDIAICFTKTDLLWGQEGFGPLAEKPTRPFPTVEELDDYLAHLDQRSDAIGRFVKNEYTAFYNQLTNAFKRVSFLSVSALGAEPEDGQLSTYKPTGVIDPLLWRLRMEGLL